MNQASSIKPQPWLNLSGYIVAVGITIFSCYHFIKVIQMFPSAVSSGLTRVLPQPTHYLWDLHYKQVKTDKNQLMLFADYYFYLHRRFPGKEIDASSVLGYLSYHLGQKKRAQYYWQKSLKDHPQYFWNYYNLIYLALGEKRWDDALSLIKQALLLDYQDTFNHYQEQRFVYWPLTQHLSKEDYALVNDRLFKSFIQLSDIKEVLTSGMPEEARASLINSYVQTQSPYLF